MRANPGDPDAGFYLRQGYPHPIAYTYNADYRCLDCTARAFGVDDEGFIPEDAKDNEGNPIGAIAPWDEWIEYGEPLPQSLVCGTCSRDIEEVTE